MATYITAAKVEYIDAGNAVKARWDIAVSGIGSTIDLAGFSIKTIQVAGTPTTAGNTSAVRLEGTNFAAEVTAPGNSLWAVTDGGPTGPWVILNSATGGALQFGGAGAAGLGNGLFDVLESPRFVRASATTVTGGTHSVVMIASRT